MISKVKDATGDEQHTRDHDKQSRPVDRLARERANLSTMQDYYQGLILEKS